MQIREANEADIPKIVTLLRKSLGESLLPKSEEVWRFKHLNNPFGKSLVMIAVVENEVVGVRAMMRWKWNLDGNEFLALRAVDTGVLPDYQGSGIFRKLNLKAVDVAKVNGDNFIFNTPNSQSLPGNLKMGWKQIEKIKIRLSTSYPHHFLYNPKQIDYSVDLPKSADSLEKLIMKYNHIQKNRNKLFTPKSVEYLKWRYEVNPLQKYEIFADKDCYLAGYIKKHNYFIELRITEHIFVENTGLDRVKDKVKEWSRKFKAPVISFSPQMDIPGIQFSGNFGPVLTYRELNLGLNLKKKIEDLNEWDYTLGDLELF